MPSTRYCRMFFEWCIGGDVEARICNLFWGIILTLLWGDYCKSLRSAFGIRTWYHPDANQILQYYITSSVALLIHFFFKEWDLSGDLCVDGETIWKLISEKDDWMRELDDNFAGQGPMTGWSGSFLPAKIIFDFITQTVYQVMCVTHIILQCNLLKYSFTLSVLGSNINLSILFLNSRRSCSSKYNKASFTIIH